VRKTPGIPCALSFLRDTIIEKLGRQPRREIILP